MKVLVVYASVEGQTARIARHIADALRQRGCDPVLAAVGSGDDIALDRADAVILAAPVHQRRHPAAFEAFVTGAAERLARCRTLMLSVSLSAAFPEGRDEARNYLEEMKMRTGLRPDAEALLSGAMRVSSYDDFEMQVIRHGVLRHRRLALPTEDREFTDYDALDATVAAFLDTVDA